MSTIAEAALALWPLPDARAVFHAQRENTIYRVEGPAGTYALRLHRPGYRTDAELASELDWMAAAARAGISVPPPLAARSGRYLETVAGVQIDVLGWLPGMPMSDILPEIPARREAVMRALGRVAARFHDACDGWSVPEGFDRPAWDLAGLVGADPLWGRFWRNPGLSNEDAVLFSDFRRVARADLDQTAPTLDYGLIHADLLAENVLVDGDTLRLIDFDDGGFGFRLFELATILIRRLDDPDFDDLKLALLDGYQSVRALDDSALDLFMVLRATTYVGWIADRMDLPDATERQAVNAKLARRLVRNYLSRR